MEKVKAGYCTDGTDKKTARSNSKKQKPQNLHTLHVKKFRKLGWDLNKQY